MGTSKSNEVVGVGLESEWLVTGTGMEGTRR